ncbi:MAG: OsmC family protein, partial [Pseudomonadota bacterium]
ISVWASHYAEAPADALPPPPPLPSLSAGATRSSEIAPDGFAQSLDVAGHALVADEPGSVGGTGRGPAPYDLLAGGLAACTSMTIRLYARRKGWPLAHVAVDVAHDRVHAEDCADCETAERRIDRFTRTVHLTGPLDEAQRTRLLEIADRCPVHRTLEASSRIETRLADG